MTILQCKRKEYADCGPWEYADCGPWEYADCDPWALESTTLIEIINPRKSKEKVALR